MLQDLVAGRLRINPKVQITICSGNTDEMIESLIVRKNQMVQIEGPELRKDIQIESSMEERGATANRRLRFWRFRD